MVEKEQRKRTIERLVPQSLGHVVIALPVAERLLNNEVFDHIVLSRGMDFSEKETLHTVGLFFLNGVQPGNTCHYEAGYSFLEDWELEGTVEIQWTTSGEEKNGVPRFYTFGEEDDWEVEASVERVDSFLNLLQTGRKISALPRPHELLQEMRIGVSLQR